MNKLELEGKWNRIKGSVENKYGKVFEDEIAFHEGLLDEVIGKVQEKTGQTKEEIEKEFDKWNEEYSNKQ